MGYIKRHWRGENALVFAFWVNGVLLSLVFRVVGGVMDAGYDPSEEQIRLEAALALFAIVSLAAWIWAVVGIWKSATRYIAEAKTTEKWAFWGYAAKLLIVVGVIGTILQIAVGV